MTNWNHKKNSSTVCFSACSFGPSFIGWEWWGTDNCKLWRSRGAKSTFLASDLIAQFPDQICVSSFTEKVQFCNWSCTISSLQKLSFLYLTLLVFSKRNFFEVLYLLRSVVLEEAVSKRGGGVKILNCPPKKDKKVTFSGLNFGVGGWGHRCRTFFLPKKVFLWGGADFSK